MVPEIPDEGVGPLPNPNGNTTPQPRPFIPQRPLGGVRWAGGRLRFGK